MKTSLFLFRIYYTHNGHILLWDQADFKPVGFGMWANRNELKNSSEWVRELRESEWQR